MSDLAREFLEFCRGKPADEAYDGGDPRRCALAQFGLVNATRLNTSPPLYGAAVFLGSIADKPEGWSTFGQLADRLEASLGEGL